VTSPDAIAPNLTPAERVLLFCLASGTPYGRVGITHSTVQQMIVRNFVERDAAGRLTLTDHGLAVLAALLPQLRAP
jgi:hypothetical protein